MNKRIKELAVEAGAQWRGGYVEQPNGDSVWQDNAKVDIADMDLTNFAELILNDIDGIVGSLYHAVPLEQSGILLTLNEQIKEHFYGVEE
jgi:hypothetical protein